MFKSNPAEWFRTGILSMIFAGGGLAVTNKADTAARIFKEDVTRIEQKTDTFGTVQAAMVTQMAVMQAGVQDVKEATKDVQSRVRNLELKMASK